MPNGCHPPKLQLAWGEILRAHEDRPLQRIGWRDHPPVFEDLIHRCPGCHQTARDLTLIYYRKQRGYWGLGGGVEGWVVACARCRKQVDFQPTLVF